MFVNDWDNKRTIDAERNIEFRRLGSGADRPDFFMLKISDVPIAIEATVHTLPAADGSPRGLVWTIHRIGGPLLLHIGSKRYEVPKYQFADANEREKIITITKEAFQTYGDLYGQFPTPVLEVLVDPPIETTKKVLVPPIWRQLIISIFKR
jgi:hypothetical protein